MVTTYDTHLYQTISPTKALEPHAIYYSIRQPLGLFPLRFCHLMIRGEQYEHFIFSVNRLLHFVTQYRLLKAGNCLNGVVIVCHHFPCLETQQQVLCFF
jgi:hypothetical protein